MTTTPGRLNFQNDSTILIETASTQLSIALNDCWNCDPFRVEKKEDTPEKDKELKEDEDDEQDLEQRTAQVYRLCTHSEQRGGEDYTQRLVVAAFLTECLHKGGFFEDGAPEDLEECKSRKLEHFYREVYKGDVGRLEPSNDFYRRFSQVT